MAVKWLFLIPLPWQTQDRTQGVIAETIKGQEAQSKIAHESLKGSASHLTKEQEDARKKYNLNTWKYAELRDTINTSVGESMSACTYLHSLHLCLVVHICSSNGPY